MSAPAREATRPTYPDAPLYALSAAALVAGPPTAALALAGQPFANVRRREPGLAALGGALLFLALWPWGGDQLGMALKRGISDKGLLLGGFKPGAAWPHLWKWWLFALPLAPVFAFLFDAVRAKTVAEQREAEEQRIRRRREREERRARRRTGAVESTSREEPAAVLGRKVSGEAVLPTRRRWVELPLERLIGHLLVVGASGSGKTETLLRLAWAVAKVSNWQIFYLDAKGDERTLRRFYALMADAGKQARLFPAEPYAGWRGSARELANRLIGLIDYAEAGGGTYYRDTAQNIVRLVCLAPGGPPRSASELLRRLRRERLEELWAGRAEADDVAAYSARQVDECRQRYQSFFRSVDGQLDGSWAFENAEAGYLLLNELLYGEETQKLARFLVEDFKQFVLGRKAQGRRVLLIVDEFSGIADERFPRVIETMRSHGAAVVLAPQVAEGMGGQDAAARIMGSVATTILHRVPNPDELVRIAGTKLVIESSVQHDEGRATGLGSAREQHTPKVPPNEVRSLPPGMCFVMGSGLAAKVQIAEAPEVPDVELPKLSAAADRVRAEEAEAASKPAPLKP